MGSPLRRRRGRSSYVRAKFVAGVKARVKVTLRPTVSRPVCLGASRIWGPKTKFLLLSDSCVFVHVRSPLWVWTDLSFTTAVGPRQRSHIYRGQIQWFMSFIFKIVYSQMSKSLAPCGHIIFAAIHLTLVYTCMYLQYIQGSTQQIMP
jgi:hypothetical protein